MSIIMSGENNPFFGKKHTDESLEKQKIAKKGNKNPFHGKKHTEKRNDDLRKKNIENDFNNKLST